MNREQFGGKDNEVDLQYCDADILNKFDADGNAKNKGDNVDLDFKPIQKSDGKDLFDFINKSDFTTVGG